MAIHTGETQLRNDGNYFGQTVIRSERVWQLRHRDLASSFPALLSLDAFRHNLPGRLTPLVGRQSELAAVVVSSGPVGW